jgi:hypothetical protein
MPSSSVHAMQIDCQPATIPCPTSHKTTRPPPEDRMHALPSRLTPPHSRRPAHNRPHTNDGPLNAPRSQLLLPPAAARIKMQQ